ncbi:MAG: efflux transporter outer membrane subunit [Desulfobacterales bacterium]|nr:efflux transporter outer membrane subunit [Desulfobacterales bacterium]
MNRAHQPKCRFKGYCLWPALFLLALAGCAAVGPDYSVPDMTVPAAWNTAAVGGLATGENDSAVLARWWETIDDPILTALIRKAASQNLDVKQALAGIRKARAQRMGSRADRFPAVDATGSIRKSGTDTGESELYSTGFDASWEIDIFGGVRRSVEASQADLEASREKLNDVMVSLLAEVAVSYIDLRTDQARLAVVEARVAAQQQTFELVDAAYRAGSGDALAAEQARTSLQSARAEIPDLKTSLEASLNSLAVLTGQAPGSLHSQLSTIAPLPDVAVELAVGVPADTLRRRPDIRKAERTLAAETARVGVATADLYPKFTLSGSIGLEALRLDELVQSASRTWRIGPSVSWAVFDAGAVRSRIEIQSAVQEQALLSYEAAVLGALEEVENALVAYAREQEKYRLLQAAAQSARSAAQLAGQQYEAGMVGFSTVLDAQRALLSFESQQVQSRGKRLSDLVRIYKALGGGWAFAGSSAS